MPSRNGYIAASMGMDFLEGFSNSMQRSKAERGFVEQAGQMFMDLGTPEGQKFAEQLMEDPRGSMMRAEAFGGFEKMYTGMKQRAAQREFASTIQTFAQNAGDEPITRKQVLTELAPAILEAGVPNGVGLVQTLLASAQSGGNVPPAWWANRVRPEDWTPDSYRAALQYGMATGDWEKGGLDKLDPRPRKDPSSLTPSAQGSQEELRILNKNKVAGDQLSAGVDPSKIDFVTEPEARWLNDKRRQTDPFNRNKFTPYKKPKGTSPIVDIDQPVVGDPETTPTSDDYLGGVAGDMTRWFNDLGK